MKEAYGINAALRTHVFEWHRRFMDAKSDEVASEGKYGRFLRDFVGT
jgi:hypothetical protein